MKKLSPLFANAVIAIVFSSFLVTFPPVPSEALESRCEPPAAILESAEGDVTSKLHECTDWQEALDGDEFCLKDMIQVGASGRALVALKEGAYTRVGPNTILILRKESPEKKSALKMLIGFAHFISPIPRMLNVITPFMDAKVDGTEFVVMVDDEKTTILVYQGEVEASNDWGSLTLTSGQAAEAYAGKAPVYKVVAKPRDAVQWALYYPNLMDMSSLDLSSDREGLDPALGQILADASEAQSQGDLPKAMEILDTASEQIRTPLFYNCRAGLLLSVGRVEQAMADLDAALGLDGQNSDALALQSIVATVNNRPDEAMRLAEKAASSDPDSPAALLALSYAHQSRFEMEAARDVLEDAAERNPENALVFARLAELRLSLEDMEGARQAAEQAVKINPDLSLTQTVKGFAHLVDLDTSAAKAAFEKAVELDRAAPLPRLGMGLALIHEGDLDQGVREIEIAAILDPNNSLIRSYLGKAYFEVKRNKKAAVQFRDAKALDPNDPTPWLYDAVQKLTENRPVEALADIEKSIELNDNRAVYRSKLMLDDDSASRGVGLAQIYKELGFKQIALAEGYKSVEADPASSSAHRFLADSYTSMPRHEIARRSQLLRSQLLQPVGIMSVQPNLAADAKYIYQRQGPSDLGYNEFTQLFDREQIAFRATGLAGGNRTFSDEVVLSGLQNNIAFSVGQFHYETDGVRDNNDQEQDIYNIFVQARLTEKTSVQAEYFDYEIEMGDPTLRFDPDNFSPNQRQTEDTQTFRVGLHHKMTPSSDLLANFAFENSKPVTDIPSETNSVNLEEDNDSYAAEFQQIFRTGWASFTSGGGHYYFDKKATLSFSATLPFPPYSISSVAENQDKFHATSFYHYAHLTFPQSATWTLGASVDFYEGDLNDTNQFNPKLGLIWDLRENTTIRAAAFRALRKGIVKEQTIEPAQVAGFNQFFQDYSGSDVWRFGVGLDQKINSSLFAGVEYSHRDIDTPYQTVNTSGVIEIKEADWDEDSFRAYLNWTPCKWIAVSAEYQYDKFERSPETAGDLNIVDLDTHQFPLQIGFFHSRGLTARVKGTYVYQDGTFVDVNQTPESMHTNVFDGDDRFFVFDASLEYRLPKRLGKVALEGKNILDESFQYQEIDRYMPTFYPERHILASITVAF